MQGKKKLIFNVLNSKIFLEEYLLSFFTTAEYKIAYKATWIDQLN
jgi:hypothetical protein